MEMRSILTIAIMISSLSVMAQTKQIKKYYKIVVVFQTTNGCYRSAVQTGYFDNGYSPNYDEVFETISKWVKPYKIKPWSFLITHMARVSKKEMLHKTKRFEPCDLKPIRFVQYLGPATATLGTSMRIINDSTFTFKQK